MTKRCKVCGARWRVNGNRGNRYVFFVREHKDSCRFKSRGWNDATEERFEL